MRIGVEYFFEDAYGRADVSYSYEIGARIIMADGCILPVEHLRPGMRFRLEDGGTATVGKVEPPRLWRTVQECSADTNGHSATRVIGTVKYTGFYPRLDLGVNGEVIQTTPGHLFWSASRRQWIQAQSFHAGEMLRNRRGLDVPVEWVSQIRFQHCELHNVELEAFHTYFVGNVAVWSHNGLEMGCRVPKAAIDEAVEGGAINRASASAAGAARPPRHHVFPQAERAWFKQRGVDIDRYTLPLDEGTHQALHYGGGPGKGGGWWNERIMKDLTRE